MLVGFASLLLAGLVGYLLVEGTKIADTFIQEMKVLLSYILVGFVTLILLLLITNTM